MLLVYECRHVTPSLHVHVTAGGSAVGRLGAVLVRAVKVVVDHTQSGEAT